MYLPLGDGPLLLNIESVTTLALGLRPRQRFARVQTKKEAQESHFVLSGM
jgi:hypothetical protein